MVATAALPLDFKAASLRAGIFEDGHAAFDTTTAETSLLTAAFTIPGGSLQDGDSMEIEAAGTLLNNSGGAVTFTFRAKLGGAAVGAAGALSLNTNALSAQWALRFVVTRLTDVSGLYRSDLNIQNQLNTASAFRRLGHGTTATVDLDTTALVVDLSAQMGTSASTAVVTPGYAVGRILAGPLPR